MGRRKILRKYEDCPESTDRSPKNALYKVLKYKYPKYADAIVTRWEAYTGLQFKLASITGLNIQLFRDRLLYDVSINTAANYCAFLSSAISTLALDHNIGLNLEGVKKRLNIKREISQFDYLSEDEILPLVEYYRQSTDLVKRAVSGCAILEFYTGARLSDTNRFTIDNVYEKSYIDKKTKQSKTMLMINYTSKKTKVSANIPIKPIVLEVLRDGDIREVDVTVSMFDSKIKAIFKEIDIKREANERRAGQDKTGEDYLICDAVTSHMFRRSFATNLRKNGVPIETIAAMMGHTNTMQTMRYDCSKAMVLDEDALNFFK